MSPVPCTCPELPTVANALGRNDETRPKDENDWIASGCDDVQKAAG